MIFLTVIQRPLVTELSNGQGIKVYIDVKESLGKKSLWRRCFIKSFEALTLNY